MIVVTLHYFSNIHRFFVYLYFQQIHLWHINVLKEGKFMNNLYFIFILFRLLPFARNFFFFIGTYLCLFKKASCAVCAETCAILVTVVWIFCFSSPIYINPTRNTFLVPSPPKKLTKFVHINSIIPSCIKMAK